MARGKTLPFVYFCPVTGQIVKSMDLSKDMVKKERYFYSSGARKKVLCKAKQHKHS